SATWRTTKSCAKKAPPTKRRATSKRASAKAAARLVKRSTNWETRSAASKRRNVDDTQVYGTLHRQRVRVRGVGRGAVDNDDELAKRHTGTRSVGNGMPREKR